MVMELFLRGRGRELLSNEELRALEDSIGRITQVPARTTLVRRGERVTQSSYLIEGYVSRYMDDRAGRRQLVAIHVAGDFVDLHGFPMHRLDHDLATLGPARIANVDHRTLQAVIERYPMLMRMLWFSTLLDAAMHREWIFGLGRLDAVGRVAHFFCEVTTRLALVGLDGGGRYMMPLTQNDLAEACGLTNVHVNRVLRTLREMQMMEFRGGAVTIIDYDALARLAEFDPAYLYAGKAEWGLLPEDRVA